MKSIKKSLLLFFALGLIGLFSTTSTAQNTNGGKTGLGVMIGEPTGITLKSWFNQKNSIDAGLAWSCLVFIR